MNPQGPSRRTVLLAGAAATLLPQLPTPAFAAPQTVAVNSGQPYASYWYPDSLLVGTPGIGITWNSLKTWTAASDADLAFNAAAVPLAARFTPTAANSTARSGQARIQSLVSFGPTSSNPSQGAATAGYYALTHWSYFDELVFWGGSGALPFASVFNTGHGPRWYEDGAVTSDVPWNHLGLQDRLPSRRWVVRTAGQRPTVTFDFADAWRGGSSVLVSGVLNQPTTVDVYGSQLPIGDDTVVDLTFRADSGSGSVNVELAVATAEPSTAGSPPPYTYLPVNSVNGVRAVTDVNGWQTVTVPLAGLSGTLHAIGVRRRGRREREHCELAARRYRCSRGQRHAAARRSLQPADFRPLRRGPALRLGRRARCRAPLHPPPSPPRRHPAFPRRHLPACLLRRWAAGRTGRAAGVVRTARDRGALHSVGPRDRRAHLVTPARQYP